MDGWMDGWIQGMLGIIAGLPNMWVRNLTWANSAQCYSRRSVGRHGPRLQAEGILESRGKPSWVTCPSQMAMMTSETWLPLGWTMREEAQGEYGGHSTLWLVELSCPISEGRFTIWPDLKYLIKPQRPPWRPAGQWLTHQRALGTWRAADCLSWLPWEVPSGDPRGCLPQSEMGAGGGGRKATT